jgi:malate dehydrogenase (oxaloacetate-decarboxylating)(NADP+)
VKKVYPDRDFSNRREYVIPTPFDPRLLEVLSVAVAKAAIDSGVAKHKITDWEEYKK